LVVVFAIGLIVYAALAKPVRHGDGHEYSLTTQAFINHLSPDIRLEDVNTRMEQVQANRNEGYIQGQIEPFADIKQLLESRGNDRYGIFRSLSGDYYGYHFWAYPAVVAAVEVLTRPFGLNPLSSFQLTNALIIVAVIAWCLTRKALDPGRRIALAAAFVAGGSIFYLKWENPEVAISACMFVGFVSLVLGNRKMGAFFLALSSVQVIALATILAIVPVHAYLANGRDVRRAVSNLWSEKVLLLIAAMPAVSAVFYFWKFGKISIIGAGYVDMDFVSLSHFWSFWFDLDQGAFVGVPWLLPLIVVVLFRWKSYSQELKSNFFVAVLGALLICVPLLAQVSVNSGQSVFLRYALYAVAPLVAWGGIYLLDIVRAGTALALMALTAAYATVFSGANAPEDYLRRKPWTNWVLRVAPSLYNPEPGVFFARARGREWWRPLDLAATYEDRNGVIRKILFPTAKLDAAMNSICIGKIVTKDGHDVDFSRASNWRYGWAYMNGEFICDGASPAQAVNLSPAYQADPGSAIDFTRPGLPAYFTFAAGLSAQESWGRWTDGRAAVMRLNYHLPEKFEVMIKAGAFGPNVGGVARIVINDVVREFKIQAAEAREYRLQFEQSRPSETATIIVYPPRPASPSDLGQSDDQRKLGLGLVSFFIDTK
jgi:hypothetical protein